MTGVLEVRKLSKSFDGIVVARDVDLTLQAGRVVGPRAPATYRGFSGVLNSSQAVRARAAPVGAAAVHLPATGVG